MRGEEREKKNRTQDGKETGSGSAEGTIIEWHAKFRRQGEGVRAAGKRERGENFVVGVGKKGRRLPGKEKEYTQFWT